MDIDIVKLLLGLLQANRESDWNFYLTCIRGVIPWCFAFDKVNYAKYLPVYCAQKTQLEHSCPELFPNFQQGNFTVKLKSGEQFCQIPADQSTEDTLNRDIQTVGRTTSFSLQPEAVSYNYVTA